MNRKRDAVDSRAFAGYLKKLALVLACLVLVGLGPGLSGCKSPGGVKQGLIRPASDTARLVKNAAYLRQSGRVELAVKELEEAHAREPGNLEVLDALTQCYEELGRFDRAQELYDSALKRLGSHPALENNRCYALALAGRPDQAESCFRQALAKNPGNQAARNNLGLILCRRGQEAEALALWRAVEGEDTAQQHLKQALAALGREAPAALAAQPGPSVTPVSPSPQKPSAAPSNLGAAPTPAISPPPSLPPSPEPRAGETTSPSSPVASAAPAPVAGAHMSSASSSTERSRWSAASPTPEPDRLTPSPAPQTAAGNPSKVKTPGVTAPVGAAKTPSPVALTARDLQTTRLELKNGTGAKELARGVRSLLTQEGFNVVAIGNHVDFGLEQTIISHRPEAEPVARVLARKFFPEARLQSAVKLPQQVDVRVSLGHDRGSGQTPAAQAGEAPSPISGAVIPAAVAKPGAGVKEAAPADGSASAPPAKTAVTPPTFLAAGELIQVRIELKNGNGAQDQARELRSRLSVEGFTVVGIGNHIDFGLEQTVITYRPEAARVARVLGQKFFPGAELRESQRLSPQADVRVSLGRDLLPGPLAQAF